uniref:Ig-like domain-containing protein n=1 Tax=Macrostomum lignano TaxID=282301 RepID=A0A1I8I070_9PLAT
MNATPPAESGAPASASRQSTKRRVRACPRRYRCLQQNLHRLWAVRLGADDVACQLESPTAQQVAWTDQVIQSRVSHSLVADLEGAVGQRAARQLVARATPSARPGLGVVQTEGSPGKLAATPQILANARNQTAEVHVDELLTTWKLCRLSISASAQNCLDVVRHAEHEGLLRVEHQADTRRNSNQLVQLSLGAPRQLRTAGRGRRNGSSTGCNRDSSIQHPVEQLRSAGLKADASMLLKPRGVRLLRNCDDVRRGPFVGFLLTEEHWMRSALTGTSSGSSAFPPGDCWASLTTAAVLTGARLKLFSAGKRHLRRQRQTVWQRGWRRVDNGGKELKQLVPALVRSLLPALAGLAMSSSSSTSAGDSGSPMLVSSARSRVAASRPVSRRSKALKASSSSVAGRRPDDDDDADDECRLPEFTLSPMFEFTHEFEPLLDGFWPIILMRRPTDSGQSFRWQLTQPRLFVQHCERLPTLGQLLRAQNGLRHDANASFRESNRPVASWAALRGVFMHLNRFAQHTSMHGVAHLFRADSYVRRAFWLLLTCLTSMAGCYHVYLTVHQFSLTPVSTLILNEGVDTIFPDVTICNLRPMPQYLLNHDSPARRQLESNMLDLMVALRRVYAKGGDIFGTQKYFHWYNLLQHYWASMDTAHLGHNLSLSMVACFYKKAPCRPADFKLVQNSHYWNCWSFRPKDRSVQGTGPNDGLNIILYTSTMPLDNSSQSDHVVEYPPPKHRSTLRQLDTVFGKAGMQVSSGVRLLVHEPGTYPHVYWEGADVGNGWSADFRFKMKRNVYVNRTGHNCVENYGHTDYWASEAEAIQRFRKRGQDCVVRKWQEHLMRKCHCQSTFLPTQDRSALCHYLRAAGVSAQNISASFGAYKFQQLKSFNDVENQVRTELYDQFASECGTVQACEQSSYTYSIASVPWPAHTDLEAFIHTFVSPKFHRARYQGQQLLDQIVRFHRHPDGSRDFEKGWSVSHRFVRQNFVKLQVFAEESKSTLIHESPSYSFVEVLSELGGIGGLWVGMSLVTFVELFEFLAILGIKCTQVASSYLHSRWTRQAGQMANGACPGSANHLRTPACTRSAQSPDEITSGPCVVLEEASSVVDEDTELVGIFLCPEASRNEHLHDGNSSRLSRGQAMQHVRQINAQYLLTKWPTSCSRRRSNRSLDRPGRRGNQFLYLGGLVPDVSDDLARRRGKAYVAFRSVRAVLLSEALSASARSQLFQAVVEIALLYNAETWSLTGALERQLIAAHAALVRAAFGARHGPGSSETTDSLVPAIAPDAAVFPAEQATSARLAGHDVLLWTPQGPRIRGQGRVARRGSSVFSMMREHPAMQAGSRREAHQRPCHEARDLTPPLFGHFFVVGAGRRQAFTLIVELLEHFNLKHSLAVLTQEAGLAAAEVTTLRDSSDNLNDKKCVKISDANPDAVEPKLVKLLKDSTNTTLREASREDALPPKSILLISDCGICLTLCIFIIFQLPLSLGMRLVLVTLQLAALLQYANTVSFPPTLTKMPPKEVAFNIGESIKLECEASGDPAPTFIWKRNEQEFDWTKNSGRYKKYPGAGT